MEVWQSSLKVSEFGSFRGFLGFEAIRTPSFAESCAWNGAYPGTNLDLGVSFVRFGLFAARLSLLAFESASESV